MRPGLELEPADHAEDALVGQVGRGDGVRVAEVVEVPGPHVVADRFGQREWLEDLVDEGLVVADVLRRDPRK